MHDCEWSWGEPGSTLPLCGPLMIEDIAAVKAAVKLGSEEMAALTLSTKEEGGKAIGGGSLCEKNKGCPCNGRGSIFWCVKSRVIVGNGWEGDRVGIVG